MRTALTDTLGAAYKVLEDAGKRDLATEAWDDIAELVDELAIAIADRAPQAIHVVVGDLVETVGASRVGTGIDDRVRTPAPDAIRVRIGELIHQIDKASDNEPSANDAPGHSSAH